MRKLTPAEQKILDTILKLVDQGKEPTNQTIADVLVVAIGTVKTHKTNIYKAFGIDNLEEDKKMSTLIEMARDIKPERKTNWTLAGILLVLIIAAAVYIFVPKNDTPGVVSPTDTLQPVEKPTEGQGIPPVSLSSETLTFTPVMATNTTIPLTFTPTTMETFTPSPSSAPVSFDLSVWKIDFGNPYVYEGVLHIEDEVKMSTNIDGNYEIKFTATTPQCSGFGWSYVGVRAVDSGNMMRLYYCTNGVVWADVRDNTPFYLEGTRKEFDQQTVSIDIVVSKNSFKVNDYEPFISDKYPKGNIFLYFWPGITVSDFQIIPLP